MRVLIDARTASDHFPGIGRYVVNLSRALAHLAPEAEFQLLVESSSGAGHLALPGLPQAVCSSSPFGLRQQWQVRGRLRRIGADVYHSPYYLMPYWPGVAAVLTCHDVIPLLYPEYFRLEQRLIFRLACWLALRRARKVICVSRATQADLIHCFHLPERRCVVIPEAADSQFTPRPPEEISAARRAYSLPPAYVLYLGSNKPHKNLVNLVAAWQGVIGRRAQFEGGLADVKLVVAGQWDRRYPESRRLAEQAGLQDEVLFVGPVAEKDLPAVYSGATLFVFPSFYEGFGLPVLEAMACGVPVTCARAGGLPEVAGEGACLFDPTQVSAITDALVGLLANPEQRAGLQERGWRQAARFSWDRAAQATLEVYQGLTH
jgi:alpha-1,3-rhamnosyl/mannosyltransferase